MSGLKGNVLMRIRESIVRVSLVLLSCISVTPAVAKAPVALPEASSALQDYIKRPDASYAWHVRQRGKQGTGEYAELILTSQTWHDVVWKHQLFIYRPAKLKQASQALLLIDGGSWSDSLDSPPENGKSTPLPEKAQLLMLLADMMQTPIAVIRQVPEQPLFDGKKEDQIIALTFAKYFETGESDWPLLLPMVKTAVRAMDAVQEFAKQEWQTEIEHFLVTGASKRGWTTWLTAASDERVDALAPMVINMLNMAAHDALQLESFGKYSEQIRDYTDRGLQQRLLTEQGASLRAIVDPIAYRKQLMQPKLIVLATNDAYWPVDALNLYWNELQGDKYILYVPNNGHGIQDFPRVTSTIAALQSSLIGGRRMPALDWHFKENGNQITFELTSDVAPTAVRRWSSKAATRDFRNAEWSSSRVDSSGESNKYVATLDRPQVGQAAAFLEAEFPGEPLPFVLTTTLHVYAGEKTADAATGSASQ
jgi:PhoPQ-activated pathogenicity-related protein